MMELAEADCCGIMVVKHPTISLQSGQLFNTSGLALDGSSYWKVRGHVCTGSNDIYIGG